MPDQHWENLKEIFHAAVVLAPEERATYLQGACRGNVSLRKAVESLIRSHEETGNFVDAPAYQAAAEMLVEGRGFKSGQIVAHYKILSLLGEGGMGEVYLAQDISLGSRVALKLLPDHFAADADRLRRFKLEARNASALNHPNILTVHEMGQDDGKHFIATEFIDGETLRQELSAGSLKLKEALDIACQVALALTAAHEARIIHRDIKPENIMLRRDRIVKVLDFGLAKLTQTTPANIDTDASTKALLRTAPGMFMGTVMYSSPEQVQALELDARTDIWSLGVVLYEMVAGHAPFTGNTANHICVAILEKEPQPLSSLAPGAPAELQRIVGKALAKDRDERYQTVRDLLIDLKSLKRELEFSARQEHWDPISTDKRDRVDPASPTRNLKWLVRLVGAIAGIVLLAGSAWYLSRFITKPVPPQQLLTAVPLTTDPGWEGMPSLSPDSSQVAYASGGPESDNFDIYVKQIGGGPPRRLTSDPATDLFPAWSPDGRSIAFIRDRGDKLEVLLIPSEGGPERKIAQIAENPTSIFSWVPPYLSWSPDCKYLITSDRASPGEPLSLFVLSVATEEKRRLTTPPATTLGDGNPAVSPDGRTLAFARIISAGSPQLYVLPLGEDCKPVDEARQLDFSQPSVVSPSWISDSSEIVCDVTQPWDWGAGSTLWRVAVSGTQKPQPIASVGEGSSQPAISRQGNRLVYARWTADRDIWRTEIARNGKVGTAVKLIASTRDENEPQYSPDGTRIVFASNRSGHSEIWICNADGSNPVQVTSLESNSGSPRWFPDGSRIVFDSNKEGHIEVYVMDIKTSLPHRLTNESSDDFTPSVSHDGKWIYFSSRRTSRSEVWRMPAEGGNAIQVTRQGGDNPFESLDGNLIYYQKNREVWKVPVAGGQEIRVLGPIAGNGRFAVAAEGIYFIEIGTRLYVGSKGNSLKFFSFAKGTIERVGEINLNPQVGLSVSPDGRYAIAEQLDPFVCDLMLVENFH